MKGLPVFVSLLITAPVVAAGCGGQTTGTVKRVDVSSDASTGGSRNGTGGAGTSSGGSTGSGLVACNDGTGNTDCCPPSAVEGGTCDGSVSKCSRGGCHAGFTSYLYCGGGTWSAGKGLFPCGVDAGSSRTTCSPASKPTCTQKGQPYCAPDWSTAESWYSTCRSQAFEPHLVHCGSYDAIVFTLDVADYFFYDNAGKLVGHEQFSKPPNYCDSYDPSFVPPDVAKCVPLPGRCPVDAGSDAPRTDAGTCAFTFSVTTVTANGTYAPENVGAIWIESSSGQFVKTLNVWGQSRVSSAVAWELVSGGNWVDAVTGATRQAHGPLESHWNCTDALHNTVSNGSYEVCVMFTEQPGFPTLPPPLHEACASFQVGAGMVDANPPDQPNFVSMHLTYR